MIELLLGDCKEKLKELGDNTIDAIVTDPPYELGFMGKSWDSTGIANDKNMWAECLRVLKPGGHLLAFSGTRTYHRMASAIEDAGFEVRDMIEWVYSTGFPKSLNIGKAIDKLQGNEREDLGQLDSYRETVGSINIIKKNGTGRLTKGTSEWEGWGTALKPAHEPICMARKPLGKGLTVAENCLKWNVGGLNVDDSRVESVTHESDDSNAYKDLSRKDGRKIRKQNTAHLGESVSLLLPQNDHLANDEKDAQSLKSPQDSQSYCSVCSRPYGERPHSEAKDDLNVPPLLCDAHGLPFRSEALPDNPLLKSSSYNKNINIDVQSQGRWPSNLIHDNSEEVRECFPETKPGKAIRSNSGGKTFGGENIKPVMEDLGYEDGGGNASRFFKSIIYQAKASKSERNNGCEGLEEKQSVGGGGGIGEYLSDVNSASGKFGSEKAPAKNNHPTVKPIALMEYLIKMVTPKGGTVFDPFMGSGTTGIAAKNLNRNFIGIEMDGEYMKIAKSRIENAGTTPENLKLFSQE